MTRSDPMTRSDAMTVAQRPERLAVAFSRLLRGHGVRVPAGASLIYAEAISVLGFSRIGPLYWAGRATLVNRPEDLPAYDRVFSTFFFRGEEEGQVRKYSRQALALVGVATARLDGPDEDDIEADQVDGQPWGRYSHVEILRKKDFAICSPEELAELERLMAMARIRGPLRRSRRYKPVPRLSRHPDLPRTVRRSLRAGGEPVRRAWKQPGVRPRRIVVLCDVSGSMEPYTRMLMRFLHMVVSGRAQVEAFTIGTRLTRVTRELALHDPDVALAQAGGRVTDWSGGTRLGEALQVFNDQWGARGLARGSVTVVFSDGWDRGDPEALATEMGRLSRVAHRVIWVNPLKGSPGYAPLARGMAAAMPHIDDFVEGHSLSSLEALAGLLSGE
jgi:uncharacterized protein with von Willebrand factor type A (vWA) domain